MPSRRHGIVTPAGYPIRQTPFPWPRSYRMSSAVQIKTGREVDNLRQLALRMGGLAEGILDKSLRAVWNRDQALAEEVAADDLEIDRIDIEIDAAVLSVLARRFT